MQGTEATEVLVHNRILWVPHYRLRGIFVAPGGIERTRKDLMRDGARMSIQQLWPRPRE